MGYCDEVSCGGDGVREPQFILKQGHNMGQKEHKVETGEWIWKIAFQKGKEEEKVWNANGKLRAKRKNPNLLCKGDVVVLPDTDTKEEGAVDATHHKFRKRLKATAKLSLQVNQFMDAPFEEDFEFDIGGKQFKGTAENGKIEIDIPIASHLGTLRFPKKSVAVQIRVGELSDIDPYTGDACSVKGAQARLNNLAFDSGPVDGIAGKLTRRATRDFQAWAENYSAGNDTPHNGLTQEELSKVDGIIGPLTAGCLKKVHRV